MLANSLRMLQQSQPNIMPEMPRHVSVHILFQIVSHLLDPCVSSTGIQYVSAAPSNSTSSSDIYLPIAPEHTLPAIIPQGLRREYTAAARTVCLPWGFRQYLHCHAWSPQLSLQHTKTGQGRFVVLRDSCFIDNTQGSAGCAYKRAAKRIDRG